MGPRLRGNGVRLGFFASAAFGLAIAAVGCGDTIPPTAEPGGAKGPEILRAKTQPTPVAQGASTMNPTAPTNGMRTPAAPTAPAAACEDGAVCAVINSTCDVSGSSQRCTCVRAEPGEASPTWSCD